MVKLRSAHARHRPALITVGAAALLALAACSSSSGGGKSTSPAPGTSKGGVSRSGLPSASAVGIDDAQSALSAYVGGTSGKADTSKSPVSVGFITQAGGIPSFPEALVAAQTAVKFVNERLGGVQGHPLQLVACTVVSTQEQAQNCAQQMAHDDQVQLVQMSLMTVGTQSIYSTLSGKKAVIGQAPTSPADVTTPDVYQPWPGTFGIQGGIVKYVNDNLHAKNVAVVYDSDDPGASFAAKTFATAFKSVGITFKEVATTTGSADVSSALVSAGALTADAVVRAGSGPDCVPTSKAAEQLGIKAPIISYDFCLDPSVKKANGGDYPKGTFVGMTHNVLAPGLDKDAGIYRAAMAAYAPAGANISGLAPYSFDSIILDVKILNQIGADKVSPDAVANWWKSFTGPLFLGPDKISCGFLADKGLPGLCSTTVFMYTYHGGGKWDPSVEVNAGTLGLGH
jgi:branched-chain amino acid transport system substrate-binding protein